MLAIADREAALLMPLDPASIGNGRLLWKAVVLSYAPATPFKASNWPTYQKRQGLIF